MNEKADTFIFPEENNLQILKKTHAYKSIIVQLAYCMQQEYLHRRTESRIEEELKDNTGSCSDTALNY